MSVLCMYCTISYGKDDPANKSIKKKFRAPSGFEPLIICVWVLNADECTILDLLDSGLKKAIYTHTNFR